MSKNYTITIPAHNSIYKKNYEENNYCNRTLQIDYSEPDEVNQETGLLLLIPGYGAHMSSNVYKKMRETFSEQYNLIVLQCNYFGNEFMQTLKLGDILNYNQDHFFKVENVKNTLGINIPMLENESNLNDMGPMQAIDNITAVLAIIEHKLNQGAIFNTKKIMIYGQSHGAYLAYLCNRFSPNLFQLIIDNSAYTFPSYIDYIRIVAYNTEVQNINMYYKYIISNFIDTVTCRSLYSLNTLYNNFNNTCYIISYHGTNDTLISLDNKNHFVKNIDKMIFMPISEDDIDGVVIKSCTHGLDCDFLKMFDMTYQSFLHRFNIDNVFIPPLTLELQMENGKLFCIDYENYYPRIKIKQ